jgi:hypothetical protein
MDLGSYGFRAPQAGNLSNYRKDPPVRAETPDPKADKVYVRILVDLSYDKPHPDPDGALRREAGAHIRRELEKALTGEMLAAKIGDATVNLRALVMRQEDDPKNLGDAVSMTVSNPAAEQARPAGPVTVQLGSDYRLDDEGYVRRADPYDSMKGGVSDADEWAEDIPPNAGSAS